MMHLSLRGSGEQFLTACESALGVRPPTAPNTVASAGSTAILWLGPDEWLVIGQEVAPLRVALAGIHSGGRRHLEPQGARRVGRARRGDLSRQRRSTSASALSRRRRARNNVAPQGSLWRRAAGL